MTREWRDALFILLIAALVGWAVWEARGWDLRARLFPWVVGYPLLVLLGVQLGLTVRAGLIHAAAGAEARPHEVAYAPGARKRAASILLWLLLFALLLWQLGFPIGGVLSTLLYLKIPAGERWPVSLAITLGTAAFFAALKYLLYVPFPNGMLLDFLGISF